MQSLEEKLYKVDMEITNAVRMKKWNKLGELRIKKARIILEIDSKKDCQLN